MKIIVLFILFLNCVYASGVYKVKSHNKLIQHAYESSRIYGAKNVLVVFDIDNTLLAMNNNFGSDQWFNWQKDLIGTDNINSIAKTFDELLKVQYDLFQMSQMRLTEMNINIKIRKLQASGIKVIALTSRGPQARNATIRELSNNGIDLYLTSLKPAIENAFIPDGETRHASYQNGVFMTSGMHKGKMLEYLLKRYNLKFSSILFTDDHEKHVSRVYEQFNSTDTEIHSYRYGKEDMNVQLFKESNKEKSIELAAKYIALRDILDN